MTADLHPATVDLPPAVARVLADLVASLRLVLGDRLRAVILYGSAAEARLRPTSDVNVAVVMTAFDRAAAERLADTLRVGRAAVRLAVMWLLEDELAPAAAAFAAKFMDMRRRRRVLFGGDPFAALVVPRSAQITRLRQVLLNLALRLRASCAIHARNEAGLVATIADAAGPLRSCAAAVLELEGRPVPPTSRAALEQVAADLGDPRWVQALARLSEARQAQKLAADVAADTVFSLIDLAGALRRRVDALAGASP
jgi:hypothetical protein